VSFDNFPPAEWAPVRDAYSNFVFPPSTSLYMAVALPPVLLPPLDEKFRYGLSRFFVSPPFFTLFIFAFFLYPTLSLRAKRRGFDRSRWRTSLKPSFRVHFYAVPRTLPPLLDTCESNVYQSCHVAPEFPPVHPPLRGYFFVSPPPPGLHLTGAGGEIMWGT